MHFIVISNGAGYVVDPDSGAFVADVGHYIHDVVPVPELKALVFGDTLAFQALGEDGQLLWCSDRISLDGMQNLSRDGLLLNGEAWDLDQSWHPFVVDLRTGKHSGGSSCFLARPKRI
jgi:hypothetical protein